MERLTYRGKTPNIAYCDYDVREIINKLAEYEDAEEQGLLHKASLKNGTPIWRYRYGCDEGIYITSDSYLFGVTEYEIGELGKDFWLSEAEAEEHIKEKF